MFHLICKALDLILSTERKRKRGRGRDWWYTLVISAAMEAEVEGVLAT